jgi:parallel beta-helix repeat protein
MRTMIIMRTAFVFYFLSAIFSSYGQSVYHVSSSGNDGNNGLSPATAFKSIDKVNSLKLNPGDQVLFNSGDTFRGQLSIRQGGTEGKPVIIGAYGSGAKPFLNGSVVVANWTNKGGNIWEADCAQCKDSVTGVYRDRYSLPLGRYPNAGDEVKGYLKILSHNGSGQFTGQQAASHNWVGGEAVVRTNDWIIDKSRISAQDGNKYTLASNTSYEIRDNWGYFIQDHPGTLDQNGEWYYDRANKKLLLYSSSADPNKHLIEATAFSRCINVYASFVTVQDLRMGQSLNIGVYGRNSSNLGVIHCDISNMGEDAVVINGSGANLTLKGNNIDHVNNDGIYITGYSSFVCQGNTLKNIGTEEGRGKSNNGQYMGLEYIYTGTDGASVIKNNELDSIGYIGIDFNSSNISVEENAIGDFDLVKNDGGAIDTYNGKNHTDRKNQKIISNIIYNAKGANAGTPDSFTGATGIYLDAGSENVEIRNNTVFNCTGSGIFLHGSNNVLVDGNTSYDNNIQFLMSDDDQDGYDSKANTISNNTFLGRNDKQVVEKLLHHQSKAADENSFPNTTFNLNVKPQNKFALNSGNDAVLFEFNKSGKPKVVELNGSYKDGNGNAYHTQLTLKPYSSIILYKTSN